MCCKKPNSQMTKQFFFNPQIEEQIKNIRRDLHLNMNGKVSESMENSGLKYKLIYGTQIPELRKIAKNYTPNVQLAECLWKMNIRETMILATMLFPLEDFGETMAENWVNDLATNEMAEFLSMNILSKKPFAIKKVNTWLDADNKILQYLACNLMLHIADQTAEDEKFAVVKKMICKLVSNQNKELNHQFLHAINTLGMCSLPFAQRVQTEMKNAKVADEILRDFGNMMNFYYE